MSYLSDFEHTKLDAHVHPGIVVQTRYISDPITGQRRLPKTDVWRVERVLGKGGFGEVRLEVCPEENERRAVKRIWATGSTFKIQYERELKALLEFSKPKYKESAAFVEFFGWFEDPESVYLAMEYVPLGDLEENVLAIGGTIKEAEVKKITVQILEGLKIMHLENFVHRDLKPKNILVCQGSPHWWVKLADFGLSKRRTEDTAYRTQTGTQAYMAPEILNYVPGINPGTSEYTNAVDIWALGCIVYRLASGVVPFPPGLSLVKFCGDESTFPSEGLALSELGRTFVRDLLVPYPSRRLAAQHALDHAWMKATSEISNSNTKHPMSQRNDSRSDFPTSFGEYNTATHAGLRSYGSAPSIRVMDPKVAEREPPKTPYHPPTVEDEEEQSDGAVGSKGDTTLDQRQEESSAVTARPPRPNSQRMPGEVEDPETTIRKPPKSSRTVKSSRPVVERKKTKNLAAAEKATMKDRPTPAPPLITREETFQSRPVLDVPSMHTLHFGQQGGQGQGQDQRSNELENECTNSGSEFEFVSESASRGRDEDRNMLEEEITSDSDSESPIHHSRGLSHSPPPRRTQTRHFYPDGTTVPIQPSRHRSSVVYDLRGPRDRSKSPPPTSTQYPVDRNLNSSPTPLPYWGEVKYATPHYSIRSAANPLDMYKRGSDARDSYPLPRGKPAYRVSKDFDPMGPTVPLTLENLNKYAPESRKLKTKPRNPATRGSVSPSRKSMSASPTPSTTLGQTQRSFRIQRRTDTDRPVYYADENGFVDSRPPPGREDNSDNDERYGHEPTKYAPVRSRKAKKGRGHSHEHRLWEPRNVLEWQRSVAHALIYEGPESPFIVPEPEPVTYPVRPKVETERISRQRYPVATEPLRKDDDYVGYRQHEADEYLAARRRGDYIDRYPSQTNYGEDESNLVDYLVDGVLYRVHARRPGGTEINI